MLTQLIDENCVIVFGAVFSQHLCKTNLAGVKYRLFYLLMEHAICMKRFHQRTHLVELPYLLLKRDPVYVVGETHIIYYLLIQRK